MKLSEIKFELKVARRGAQFGMPAPLLVQFEKEIDRELAKENPDQGAADDADDADDAAASNVEYGPHAQIVTNDLRSLDEMVSSFFFLLFVYLFSFFFLPVGCFGTKPKPTKMAIELVEIGCFQSRWMFLN